MKQYKVVQFRSKDSFSNGYVTDGAKEYSMDYNIRGTHEKFLNMYAREGWKMVQVVPLGDMPHTHLIYFERDI